MYSHNFEEVLDVKKQAAEVSVLPTEMTMSCLSKNLHEGVDRIYHNLSSISQESFEIKTLPADFPHIRCASAQFTDRVSATTHAVLLFLGLLVNVRKRALVLIDEMPSERGFLLQEG